MKNDARRELYKRIAKERIDVLFGLAEKEFDKHVERSRRYVQLARKIGLRYNVRFDAELKRNFCKKCNTLLIPGKTSTTRTDSKSKTINVKCTNCGDINRFPYK